MRILLAFVLCLGTAAPAFADRAPPPIERPKPVMPTSAIALFEALAQAFKSGDAKAAEALVDARGWSENLVGGSGQPFADSFREGAREKWFPRVIHDGDVAEVSKAIIIVPADIVGADGRLLDRVDVLIVRDGDQWKVLGAGERRAEVLALANRYKNGEPLAPVKSK